jgi:hypothetical protein
MGETQRTRYHVPLTPQHCSQVVHAPQCGWMLFAQHCLMRPKCLSMHLFRLLVLALIPQHCCQVVHARQCVRMLSTRSLTQFPEMKRPNLIPIRPSTYTIKKITHDSYRIETLVINGRWRCICARNNSKVSHQMWDESHSENGITSRRRNDINQQFEPLDSGCSLSLPRLAP